MKNFSAMVWVLAAALLCIPKLAFPLSTPEWLYTVEVSVTNQSTAERDRAAQVALLAVLTRLTGLVSIPRSSEVQAALAAPTRYYDEFLFYGDEHADQQKQLRIIFQRDAVLGLVQQARLPIWWTKRPKVLAWVVLQELGERKILDAHSEHPLRLVLIDAAKARGIDIGFPLMDLDDQLKIDPKDIWRDVRYGMEEIALRYGAEINLVGRVQSSLSFRGRQLKGDWRYWLDGQNARVSFDTDQYETVVHDGLDGLVAELLRHYSVFARQNQRWALRVSGVRDVGAYTGLVNYLAGLDFINHVALSAIEGDVLTLVLSTSAQAEQLFNLLTTEQTLVEDTQHLGRGVQLMWRG